MLYWAAILSGHGAKVHLGNDCLSRALLFSDRMVPEGILPIALYGKIANLKCRNTNTPWCNGNTAPFGGVILGSNPSGVAT